MRRVMTLTATILILFSAITSAIFVKLNSEKDNVIVTENVRYGDKSYAENIKVNFVSHYQNSLFWNTEYTIGNETETKTKFSFYKRGHYTNYSTKFLNIYSDYHYDYNNRESNEGINKAYNELASTAEPYVEAKKEILLSDYYDYYPYDVDISFPGKVTLSTDFGNTLSAAHKEFVEIFRNFFKIPVLKNHKVIITLQVNENGDLHQSGLRDANDDTGDFSFYSDAIPTDDEFFICFSNKTTTGLSVDTSEIPGGYGVYVLPFTENEKEVSIDAKNLKNILPVDEEYEIYSMHLSEDSKKLFIMTKRDKTFKAFILDTDTYEKLGEFTVAENIAKDDYAYFQCIKDDYILVTYYLENFQKEYYKVFTCDSSYNYKAVYTVPIYETAFDKETQEHIGCGTYPGSLSQIKFDGNYLYVSSDNLNDNYDNMSPHSGFTIAIYGKDGLVYHGDYDTSLSAGNDGNYDSSFYVYTNYDSIVEISLP